MDHHSPPPIPIIHNVFCTIAVGITSIYAEFSTDILVFIWQIGQNVRFYAIIIFFLQNISFLEILENYILFRKPIVWVTVNSYQLAPVPFHSNIVQTY